MANLTVGEGRGFLLRSSGNRRINRRTKSIGKSDPKASSRALLIVNDSTLSPTTR